MVGELRDFIDIVFSGDHGPADTPETTLAFVEVEGPDGASISVGEWIDRGNGLKVLRIPRAPDMTCEAHPWEVWPHVSCIGPGMPIANSLALLDPLL